MEFLIGNLVEEAEVDVKVIAWIQMFSGNVWVTGYDTVLARVFEIGNCLGGSIVKFKLGHFVDKLVGGITKLLGDELNGYIRSHTGDDIGERVVCTK